MTPFLLKCGNNELINSQLKLNKCTSSLTAWMDGFLNAFESESSLDLFLLGPVAENEKRIQFLESWA